MNSTLLHLAAFRDTTNPLLEVLSASLLPTLAIRPELGPVAIVDDDKWVLKSLERLLKSGGFRVKTFISAEDFLQSEKDSRTVCLILDIGLPGMSGLDLQRHLAAENSQVPIIFVSAYDETDMRTQAMSRGAVAFLSKPVNDQALLEAVDSAVKQ